MMMRYLAKGIVGCLCVASVHLNAETFLNDSALLNQRLEHTIIAGPDVKSTGPQGNGEFDISIKPELTSSSAMSNLVDPGFTPSHEVMRETEEKREASDRLWQSILNVF